MALKRVKILNYDGVAYAPSVENAVINLDAVELVKPVETRRSERCVHVRFRDGKTIECVGVPDDFVTGE